MQNSHYKGPQKAHSSSSYPSRDTRFSGSRGHSSRPSTGGRSFGGSYKGGNRPARQAPSRGRRNNAMGSYIDPSRFINKVTTVTEEVAVFKPEHAFADFLIDERLKKTIITKGYKDPTPIQDKTIPHILKGSDLVGIANTGTGKTAAFLIPLIQKVIKDPKENVLIIVPTRELAIQIDTELKAFARGLSIFSVCCVGGMAIGRQISALKYRNNFVIGTPGRLKDLMDRKMINPANFKSLVLDEADRMLDMGFINDMRSVMSLMPKDRHTLFFSATLSSDIERLIGEFLKTPVRISVKTGETSKNVEQDVVKTVPGKNKLDVLHDLLNQKDFSRVLIFGRTKHGVEKLSQTLLSKGFKAESIHGNKNHSKRQTALRLFKEGNVQILVATDVAARGLDIADVSHVINYELPATYEDYVHRIGRTGRGNKKGKALTFLD
jgi:ATP-dependent RNA helicase RhlE